MRSSESDVKRFQERQRTESQRPEAWLLRDLIAQRRAVARAWISRSTATPDRPVLVGLGPAGRVPEGVPLSGRGTRPAISHDVQTEKR
jgi:hypothetical protein